jgi:predicted PurR-regulated permease PerM
MTENVNNRHGNGLVLILLALSIAAIIWLFTPFIAYLFLSLLICISTYSSFNKLSNKYSKNLAAVIMTLLVTVLLILPLGYILLVSGIEITALINKLQSDYQVSEISRITDQIIMGLSISDSIREFLDNSLRNNLAWSNLFNFSGLSALGTFSSGNKPPHFS